jgi:hypothetical protein
MRNHRLNRLALLTQGVALVGIGMSALAACNDPPHVNSPPPDRPNINSPPQQPLPSAAPVEPDHVNGPATPPPTASGSASSAVAPVPVPAHVNAMPKKPPPPPAKP